MRNVEQTLLSALCLLAAMLTTACSTTRVPRDARLEPVRTRLQSAVANGEAVSVSIAVAIDGETVWEEAFGLADVERGIRTTPDTQYAIASITKPITATGVLSLGIDIDKPVTGYLGAQSIRAHADDASKATVRAILRKVPLLEHGYGVLEALMERVSGRSYEDYLREEVFAR